MSSDIGPEIVTRRGDERGVTISRGDFVCFPSQSGVAVGIVTGVHSDGGIVQLSIRQVVDDGVVYDCDPTPGAGAAFTLRASQVWAIEQRGLD